MAETPTIRVSEAGTLTALHRVTPLTLIPEVGSLTVFGYPTPLIESSQAGTLSATNFLAGELQVSEISVVTIAQGRIEDPTVRAWLFDLDGHDFYVLRVGDEATLVYDTYSETWLDWASPGINFWRAKVGRNWLGGQSLAPYYGSNIIVGDDVHGLLYFLNPDQPYDEPPIDYDDTRKDYFERIVMGQIPVKGREIFPCYVAFLTTDMGDPAYEGASVQLLTSDDAGKTFDDQGFVTVNMGEFAPELSWYSIGQASAPGRLFKIIDDGAITRIDSFDINDQN